MRFPSPPCLSTAFLAVVLVMTIALLSTSCDTAHSLIAPTVPATSGSAGSTVLPTGSSTAPLPAAGTCAIKREAGQDLPDPHCTPGAINHPAVTQATLASTICASGWTKTVRPPTSKTSKIKKQIDVAYGLPTTTKGELDHLVSLELGGAPLDPRNLWVEPGTLPNPKDAVENQLNSAVCSGLVPLAPAQQAIATDWPHALTILGLVVVQGQVCLRNDPRTCASKRHGDETGE